MIDALRALKNNRNLLQTAELPEARDKELWKATYAGTVETLAETLRCIQSLLSLKSTKKDRALAMGYVADILNDYNRISAAFWNSEGNFLENKELKNIGGAGVEA